MQRTSKVFLKKAPQPSNWYRQLKPQQKRRLRQFSEFPPVLSSHLDTEQDSKFNGMEVVSLGTGGGAPSLFRNFAGVAVRLPGQNWLFDCGEGTTRQLMSSRLRVPQVNKIFVTHMHGDHIFGLPGFLCGLNVMETAHERDAKNKKRIDVYGPEGLFQFLNGALTSCRTRMAHAIVTVHEIIPRPEKRGRYGGRHHNNRGNKFQGRAHPCLRQVSLHPEMHNSRPQWTVFEDEEYKVSASSVLHTVPTFGYVVEEKDKPGHINVEAAVARGLKPGPLYGRLKRGLPVDLEDGSVLHPHEVIGNPIKGRKVTILGDTACSANMVDIAQNSDLVVHEATLFDELKHEAGWRGHSTAAMAGYFAKQIDATLLALTHFSSRTSFSGNTSVNRLISDARKSFGKKAVVASRDLLRISIPRKDSEK